MNRLNSKCVCNQAASHVIYNLHRFFTVKSESIRSSKKILNHFKVKNQESILDLFPNELKSSICKAEPKSVYVADEDAAKTIANAISKHHNKSVPFLECNPGPGILTKSLINHLDLDALRLIESNSNFNAIQTVRLFFWKLRPLSKFNESFIFSIVDAGIHLFTKLTDFY